MKKIADLNDLMIEQLRDLYHGEKKLEDLLPRMIANAENLELKEVLEAYYKKCEAQIMRIRQVFELLFVQKRGVVCDAMVAMAKQTESLMDRSENTQVRDASLITSLQHIIHYQMAGYGAICTYAQMLDLDNIAEIIHQNLEEAKETDRSLIGLAEREVNIKATQTA